MMCDLASSTLVNVAEDAEFRLIGLLVEAAPTGAGSMQAFQEHCNRSIVAGDAAAVLTAVIDSNPSAVQSLLALESTDEACAAFSLITALLQRVRKDHPESEDGLAKGLGRAVLTATNAGNSVHVTERKIMLLSVLYNMRPKPFEKCQLLESMTALAGVDAANLLHPDSVIGRLFSAVNAESSSAAMATSQSLPPVVALLDSWKIAPSDRRPLYSSVVKALGTSDVRRQQFLLLLIDTYADLGSIDVPGLNAAKEAAVGAIRDPVSLFHHQRNLLNKPAIRSLSKNEPRLYSLLQVVQEGKLSDYEEFVAKEGGEDQALKPWGIDPVACKRFVRILSLCSLAAEHEEVPYSEIASTLRLPSDSEVETWVIAAVNSGLLQAKMDQLAQKVMVERCIVRRFDMENWKALQAKLALWKQNVGNILISLKSNQASPVVASSM